MITSAANKAPNDRLDGETIGRDKSTGRFVAGNPGGPGRKPRATEAEYLRELADVVSIDEWRSVCVQALELAKAGDPKAREWLGKYLLPQGPLVAVQNNFGSGPDHDGPESRYRQYDDATSKAIEKAIAMMGGYELQEDSPLPNPSTLDIVDVGADHVLPTVPVEEKVPMVRLPETPPTFSITPAFASTAEVRQTRERERSTMHCSSPMRNKSLGRIR